MSNSNGVDQNTTVWDLSDFNEDRMIKKNPNTNLFWNSIEPSSIVKSTPRTDSNWNWNNEGSDTMQIDERHSKWRFMERTEKMIKSIVDRDSVWDWNGANENTLEERDMINDADSSWKWAPASLEEWDMINDTVSSWKWTPAPLDAIEFRKDMHLMEHTEVVDGVVRRYFTICYLPIISPEMSKMMQELREKFDLPPGIDTRPVFRKGGIGYWESWNELDSLNSQLAESH